MLNKSHDIAVLRLKAKRPALSFVLGPLPEVHFTANKFLFLAGRRQKTRWNLFPSGGRCGREVIAIEAASRPMDSVEAGVVAQL